MLKFDSLMLLALLLLVFNEAPNYVTMLIAFLAGLSISTGSELYKSTFTAKKFFIRLLYVFGLSVIGIFLWQDYGIKTNIVYYIFTVTLFSELIVMLVIKAGTKLIKKYFNNIEQNNG